MTALLIDDDIINTSLLAQLISTYCPSVNIVGSADSVEKGIEMIFLLKPKLVFLDIEIHNKNARDILQVIDTSEIYVVLLTAYEKYALEMIQYHVKGYLLKPIEITRLINVIKKLEDEIERYDRKIYGKNNDTCFLTLGNDIVTQVVSSDKIINIEASGNYSKVYLINNVLHLVNKPIKEYEKILPEKWFIRVHTSHIINLQQVKNYIKNRNGTLVMQNGLEIPISASRKSAIDEKLIVL